MSNLDLHTHKPNTRLWTMAETKETISENTQHLQLLQQKQVLGTYITINDAVFIKI